MRRPHLRVLVAEEDMAVVDGHGTHEGALPEVGSEEPEIGVAAAASAAIGEKTLALEAPGGAAELGGGGHRGGVVDGG